MLIVAQDGCIFRACKGKRPLRSSSTSETFAFRVSCRLQTCRPPLSTTLPPKVSCGQDACHAAADSCTCRPTSNQKYNLKLGFGTVQNSPYPQMIMVRFSMCKDLRTVTKPWREAQNSTKAGANQWEDVKQADSHCGRWPFNKIP